MRRFTRLLTAACMTLFVSLVGCDNPMSESTSSPAPLPGPNLSTSGTSTGTTIMIYAWTLGPDGEIYVETGRIEACDVYEDGYLERTYGVEDGCVLNSSYTLIDGADIEISGIHNGDRTLLQTMNADFRYKKLTGLPNGPTYEVKLIPESHCWINYTNEPFGSDNTLDVTGDIAYIEVEFQCSDPADGGDGGDDGGGGDDDFKPPFQDVG